MGDLAPQPDKDWGVGGISNDSRKKGEWNGKRFKLAYVKEKGGLAGLPQKGYLL